MVVFSRPCEAVQPEDALILLVRQPILKLEEDLLPRSPQASLPVPRTVTSIRGAAHTVKKSEIHPFLFTVHRSLQVERRTGSKTHDQQAIFLVDVLLQGRLAWTLGWA